MCFLNICPFYSTFLDLLKICLCTNPTTLLISQFSHFMFAVLWLMMLFTLIGKSKLTRLHGVIDQKIKISVFKITH